MSEKKRFETKALHAGQDADPTTGAVVPPVYFTSTYKQESPGQHKGYEYSRTGNPTRTSLEQCLAALENGKYCTAYSSGMGAATTFLHTLDEGAHIVSCDDVYGGIYRLFTRSFSNRALRFSYVDMAGSPDLNEMISKDASVLWIETPTNPLLKLIDIERICEFAKRKGILTLVDNTFASPYLQNPLDLGADVVLHSTTKFLGGHSDVVGGALITNRAELAEKLSYQQNAMGATPGPMDAWLTLRGVKTLAVRMERHLSNAMKVAEFLKRHSMVQDVLYPGLSDHPQHALAKKQMRGFGGIVSVRLKADLEETKAFLSGLQIFTLAESLGAVESLVDHPAIMTHSSLPPEIRRTLGITDGFLRFSVGLEHIDDLLADLENGFAKLR